MKKVLVFCVCLIGILSADWKRVMGSSDAPLPPEKNVIRSDSSGIFVRTAVFGFNEQDTTVDNKDFKRIEIPEEPIDRDTINAGKPQIPYIRLLIAVPDSCDFDITVYESDYTLFEDYLIYPVPRIVFETDTSGCICPREVYTYDASFYEKDTLYPCNFYEVNSDGYWRDQRVLEVFLYPIQFNPGQELMYFYSGLDLRIEYSGEVVENENGLGPFEDIGREILLNYPGIDRELPPHDPPEVHYYTDLRNTDNIADYIIVTHEDFLGQETDSLLIHEFAQWWVNHNQFDVGIVKMQDVYNQFPEQWPDSAAQLRDFLVYAYDNWNANSMTDSHFAYCLFIGDWNYVPTRLYLDVTGRLAADEGYFRDLIPGSNDEIMLGRWPVRVNTQDLNIIAQKTIGYESEPDTGDWRRRGLLIAGGDTALHCDMYLEESKPYLSDIGYDTLIVRFSQLTVDEYQSRITDYLNLGEILTVYYGHGGVTRWWRPPYNYTNLLGLENGSKLPVVLSMACLTASFHKGIGRNCFGEHFIFKNGGGCIAFYGATCVTSGPSFQNALRILNKMLRYQNWILGKCLVDLGYGKSYCLLGDPALDLGDYTALPDYPDLVVRPQGIDISLLSPYPYPTINDVIPIRAKIWNIGGAAAHDVKVYFKVESESYVQYSNTAIIPEIQPRDTAIATVYWNTELTHPDFYGEIGDCDFVVTVDSDSEIAESWEYNNTSSITKKIALYPNEPGWPKQVTGITQPAIANLDGTGSVEIVCAGLDSVYVFDPEGNQVLPWPEYFENVYGIVLGDISNNGYIDIVAVSPESIKVYDYQGNILPGWPVQIGDITYEFTGFPALGRIESGVSDVFNVVVGARNKSELTPMPAPMKIFVYDRQGSGVFEFNTSAQVPHNSQSCGFSIENIISDGNDEIVLSYLDAQNQLFKTEVFNCNDSVAVFDYGNDRMVSALVDLNNDGYTEMITGGSDGMIRAYDVENNQLLWERQTEGPINCSPAVGDIHPVEYGVEITFGNDSSRVHLREKDYGDNILPWPDTVGGQVRTSPAIANMNGDHDIDIMIGADNNYIYAFKYTMERIPPFPLPLFGTPSSPVIGDIDGDTKNEVILSSSDGYLHVWENKDTKVPPYSLEWPQFHHDYQRTGVYGWVGGLRGGNANPKTFSTGTTLSFMLEDNLHTKIKIFDAEGHPVKTLVNQTLPQGTYHPVWYGKDNNYAFLPDGIYFIEIKVRNESKIIPVEINR